MAVSVILGYPLQIYYYTYRLNNILQLMRCKVMTAPDTALLLRYMTQVLKHWEGVKNEFKSQSKWIDRYTAALTLPVCFAFSFWLYFVTQLAAHDTVLQIGGSSVLIGMGVVLILVGLSAPEVVAVRHRFAVQLHSLQVRLNLRSQVTSGFRLAVLRLKRRILRQIQTETPGGESDPAVLKVTCCGLYVVTRETALKMCLELGSMYLLFLTIIN